MERIAIGAAPSFDFEDGIQHRSLQEALGLENVSINRYRLDGETRMPWGLHAHLDQEEVFIVLEGELTFETLDGTLTLAAGEAIRFAPGEFQAAKNTNTADTTFLAIGAPAGSEEMSIPKPCPTCSEPAMHIVLDTESEALRCPSCGHTVDAGCRVCGEPEREIRLDSDGSTVIDVCRSCGDRELIT